MKYKTIIKTILSSIFWGFGQLLNRQYIKALFFFLVFVAFIGIELGTSHYFINDEAVDNISLNKIPGKNLGTFYNIVFLETYDQEARNGNKDLDFENYLINELKITPTSNGLFSKSSDAHLFTEEKFIEYFSKTIDELSYIRYQNIQTNNYVLPDDWDDSSLLLLTKDTLYYDEINNLYYRKSLNNEQYEETNIFTLKENKNYIDDVTDFLLVETTGVIYTANNKYYVEAKIDDATRYIELRTDTINIEQSSNAFRPIKKDRIIGPIYESNNEIYEYYEPGLRYNTKRQQYIQPKISEYLRKAVYTQNVELVARQNPVRSTDYVKLMIKVYLELNPNIKESYLNNFNNFYYDRAGMFVKGVWEVVTLGQTEEVKFNEHLALTDVFVGYETAEPTKSSLRSIINYEGEVNVRGHVSTLLLLEGLIAIILSLFFIFFGVWSAVDAYRVSNQLINNETPLKSKEYFKDVWENSFEYIVLSPAMFVLAFITIMPIVFGFVLAFTSIGGNGSMDKLFDWVGFKNFIEIFDPNTAIGQGFSIAFWRVLGWTIIWAVLSTFTVFFGGFFQALIVNAESVVFKKLWRTILILPWAIPALLSQMVFRVIFNEGGMINELMNSLGFYKLFKGWGILGQSFQSATGWAKTFWLGHDNIQWFTNSHNPNFVRITLVVVNIWLGFPYFMALMTGIMTAIDKSLYEAADIDGATGFQKLVNITMPLVLYSTAPILIMTFSGNFNNFGVIYFITGGGPGDLTAVERGYAGQTDILISWMYRLTVDWQIYNMASVFSVLIFIVVGSVTAWNLSKTNAFTED